MKVSAKDVRAMLDYIQGNSIMLGQRVSMFCVPPHGEEERYTHLSIGRRSDSIVVSGYGENLTCTWRDSQGNRRYEALEELIKEEENESDV